MWKVLGKSALTVTVGTTWQERVTELSKGEKDADRFMALMEEADLRYFYDTIKDIHTFLLRFDPHTDIEDLEFVHDFILKVHAASKEPVVEFGGEPQQFTVVITAEEDSDIYDNEE